MKEVIGEFERSVECMSDGSTNFKLVHIPSGRFTVVKISKSALESPGIDWQAEAWLELQQNHPDGLELILSRAISAKTIDESHKMAAEAWNRVRYERMRRDSA